MNLVLKGVLVTLLTWPDSICFKDRKTEKHGQRSTPTAGQCSMVALVLYALNTFQTGEHGSKILTAAVG